MSHVHHLLLGLLGAGLGVACHSLGADPDALGTIGHADEDVGSSTGVLDADTDPLSEADTGERGSETSGGTTSLLPGSSDEGAGGCPPERPVVIDEQCYAPVRPHAFHYVHKDFPESWDAVWELAQAHEGPLIASQNKPEQVPYERWAHNWSPAYFENGTQMADYVHERLSIADEAPRVVMWDELRPEHLPKIVEMTERMLDVYPQWAGRWGVYVVNGTGVSYANLQPAIDVLLQADARLAVEIYPAHSQYCQAGGTAGARDQWLAAFFRGEEGVFPQKRFRWLVQRRNELQSNSELSVLFGTIDTYLDGAGAEVFLDRIFYVWRTQSGFGSLLDPDVGGAGAYKWHDHGPTSRDHDFVTSYEHYALLGSTSSRLGQVTCP